ncbi:DUF2252 family protein [Arthrobacter sp. UYCu511]|uniref:DUF2252 family protein n=1 Tax=Arthrobacter sp. UYCu511 TaxID=3156337 RepID=UPI0033933587
MPQIKPRTVGSAPDRPDPVTLLEGQSVLRVPELVPIRYGQMMVSPFTFFRGGRRFSWPRIYRPHQTQAS